MKRLSSWVSGLFGGPDAPDSGRRIGVERPEEKSEGRRPIPRFPLWLFVGFLCMVIYATIAA